MYNLRVKIPDYKDALIARFRSWLDKREFRPHKFRGVLVGSIMTIVLCEVACYRMLQSIVRVGDIAPHVPDLMIIVMALLEAMVSPFVSWFGYWRRRTVMVVVMPMLVLSTVTWLLLPEVTRPEESEFCLGSIHHTPEVTPQSSTLQLSFILVSCVLFLLARVAVWCHGFAYIEEHAPERLSVHMGVLVFVRTISLAIDYHMIGAAVKTSQIVGFIINFTIQILQLLYFMPSATTRDKDALMQRTEDRRFFVSICRVISNPLVLSQMASLGLLAAAVWGFGYHSSDIIKVKYLMPQNSGVMEFFAEVFLYYGTLMAVLYTGLKWSEPIQVEFCQLRALRQSFMKTLLVGVLLTVMAVSVNCPRGKVAGVGDVVYTSPTCSDHCRCSVDWMEFSPVCVVEEMTSYLSPCQAGCAGAHHVDGVMVYSNCTCAPNSVALPGACSDTSCRGARNLYRMLYVLLLTFCVLGFQSHGVLLMKTVDARDKSVVMGLAGAAVSIFAFVLGHLAFSIINGMTCIWFSSKRCHLHSPQLSILAGLSAAGLAFSSAALCLVTLVWMTIKARRKLHVTPM